MTISYVQTTTPVYSTGSPNPGTITHNSGDLLILMVGTKPDTTPATTPAGWSLLGTAQGGTGTTGIDTGPMRVGVFYRIATGDAQDAPGAITVTGNNVSAVQMLAFRATSGTYEIAGVGAADTTTGSPMSVTMPSNPGLTVDDHVVAVGVIPTDVTTPSQFTSETVSAPGMTTVTLTEISEWDTSSGQDMGGWVARGVVATGTATGAPTVSATASGTTTNVAGPIYLIRIRDAQVAASGTESSSIAVSETSSITVLPKAIGGYETVTPTVVSPGVYAEAASTSVFGVTDTAVPAGNKVFALIAWWGASGQTLNTVTGGSLTWTIDVIQNTGNYRSAIASADAPSGLPSSTNVIAVFSPAADARYIRILTASGIQTGASAKDAQVAVAGDTDGGYSVDLTTTTANTLLIAHTWRDFTTSTLTPSGTAVELYDHTISPASGMYQAEYQNETSAGSKTIAASGPVATSNTVVAAAYKISPTLSDPADTGSIAVSETTDIQTSGGGGPTPISGSESRSLAISETSTIAKSSSTTDTGSIALSETSSITSTLPGTESVSVSITEQTSIVVTRSTTDTGSIAVSETSTPAISLSTTDTSSISVSETSAIAKSSSTTDTGSIAISESVTLVVQRSTTDTGSLAVSDSAQIAIGPSTTDTGSIAVSETATIASTTITTDTASLAASDTTSQILVTLAEGGRESNSLAVSETSQIAIGPSTSDTASIAITEASSISGTISASESNSLAVNEVANVTATQPGTETVAVSITEQSSVAVTQSASDTGSLVVSETSSVSGTADSSESNDLAVAETNELLVVPYSGSGGGGTPEITTISAGNYSTSFVNSISDTTTDAVPAGDKVFAFIDFYGVSHTVTSVSGGGLDWTIDIQTSSTGERQAAIATADAPDGLASGTTITANFASSGWARNIRIASVSGLAPDEGPDTTYANVVGSGTSGINFNIDTNNDNEFIVVSEWVDFYSGTRTGTAPLEELYDYATVETNAHAVYYAVFEDAGTQNIIISDDAGSNHSRSTVAATYKTAGGVSEVADSASVAISESADVEVVDNTTPITGEEDIALVITETSSVSGTVSASDTDSLEASETSSIAVSSSTSDTDSVAVTETTATTAQFTATENRTIAVSEASSIAVVLSTTDTGSLAVSDAANVGTSLPGTDSAAIGLAEQSSIVGTVTSSDTAGLNLVEGSLVNASSTSTDTGSLATSETASVSGTVSSTDTGSLSSTESAGIDRSLPGTESIALGVVEAAQILVAQTATDEALTALTETASIAKSSSTSDTSGLAITDTSAVSNVKSASDTGSIAVSETTDIVVGGGADKAGSDSASIAISETASNAVQITVTDGAGLAITDTSSADKSITATESNSIAVTETKTLSSTISRPDTGAISVTESAQIYSAPTATDSAAISVNDIASPTAMLPGSDTVAISLTEQSSVEVTGGLTKSASDATLVSVTESSTTFVSITATDGAGIAISETIYKPTEAADSLTIGLVEQSQVIPTTGLFTFDSTDGAAIRITEYSDIWLIGDKNIPVHFASNVRPVIISSTSTVARPSKRIETRHERNTRFE